MGPISCDLVPLSLHCHSLNVIPQLWKLQTQGNLMCVCVFSGVWWSCHRPLSGPHGGLHSGQRPQQPLGCYRSHHHTAYVEGREDHRWWGWEILGQTSPVSCPFITVRSGRWMLQCAVSGICYIQSWGSVVFSTGIVTGHCLCTQSI